MKKKPIVVAVIVLVSLLLITYIGGGVFFQNHFLPNTKLGTLDLSGTTIAEANRKIARNVQAKNMEITENGQILLHFTPFELETSVNGTGALEQAKAKQGSWSWPFSFFQEYELSLEDVEVAYDEAALSALLESIPLDDANRTAPKNARVKSESGTFVIHPEETGTIVDRRMLEQQIITSLASATSVIRLEDAYQKPVFTSKNPKLQEVMEELADITDFTITYTLAGEELVLGQEQLVSFFSIDNEGNPFLDQTSVYAYLKGLHDQYATHEKTRTFESTNRGTVEVPPGSYGWSIALETETKNLMAYIEAQEDITVRPAILGSGYHDNGTDIGNSYVEVDLAAQKLYLYNQGTKVFETPIVSGQEETPTPPGVYYAWEKAANTEIADGTPVGFWVGVDWSGMAIHDANWQSSFSADAWKENGSKGNIYLPPDAMAQLYHQLEIGIPVLIY